MRRDVTSPTTSHYFDLSNVFHIEREVLQIKTHAYLVTIRATARAIDIKSSCFFIAACNARVVRFQELKEY